MYCMGCGAKLEDGATFCTSCGTKVGSMPPNTQVAAPQLNTPIISAPNPREMAASSLPTEAQAQRSKHRILVVCACIALVAAIVVVAVVALSISGHHEKDHVYHNDAIESSPRSENTVQLRTFSDNMLSLQVPEDWGSNWIDDCKVIHSVQSGTIPNAWQYTFTNTSDPSQSFDVVIQVAGSYLGDTSNWVEVEVSDPNTTCYIKSKGLSFSEVSLLIDSIKVSA